MALSPEEVAAEKRAAEAAQAQASAARAALSAAQAAKYAAELAGADYLPRQLSDYYNSRYSEYLNQYRFFGTLRAGVAWAPATISVAVVAFLFEQFATDTLVLSGVIAVIFLAIFAMNLALQREQIIHLKLSSECDKVVRLAVQEKTTPTFQAKIAGTIFDGYLTKSPAELPSHEQMRTAVRKKISVLNYVQEVATIALLVFLIALGGTAVVITNQIDFKLDRFRDSGSVEGITGS